jgi:hypothetical protein
MKYSRENVRLALILVLFVPLSACDGGCEKKTPSSMTGDAPDEQPLDFEGKIRKIRSDQRWDDHKTAVKSEIPKGTVDIRKHMDLKMNREIYGKSFEMGSKFLQKYQNPEGNFKYQYDWLTKAW